jgi:hypothetical protein
MLAVLHRSRSRPLSEIDEYGDIGRVSTVRPGWARRPDSDAVLVDRDGDCLKPRAQQTVEPRGLSPRGLLPALALHADPRLEAINCFELARAAL